MATNADTPADPIDATDRLTAARTATAAAIDPERYADIPAGVDTFYLAALGALAGTDEHLAVFATADGAHVQTHTFEDPPHAIGGLRRPGRSTLRRHGRRMVATLSEIIAEAHPEVER